MSKTREILTLQFGNYANYVGTHWWNIQESGFVYTPEEAEKNEINADVLFREGVNYRNDVTYTPRLLLVDLKGVLRHCPEQGDLYEQPVVAHHSGALEKVKQNIQWDYSNVEVVQSPVIEKPEFQKDLDQDDEELEDDEVMAEKDYELHKTVSTWTDYMYARYHPRSINIIRDHEHSDESTSFDTFTSGKNLWKTDYFEDDFTDKIRQYVEECDFFQGFQVLFDCVNGFSGLTLQCLEYLKDDYTHSVFALPLIPPKTLKFQNTDEAMSDTIRMVNIAMTYSGLDDLCSLFLPLSTMEKGWRQIQQPREFPLITYENDNYYQTSAIIASYLDTISLRYRLKNPSGSNFLPGFCSDMNNYGRKLAGAGLALPFKMSPTEDLIDCLDKVTEPFLTSLTPNTDVGTDRIIQSVCVRGIPINRLKRPRQSAQKQMQMAAYRCESVSEMFQLYFQCSYYSSLSHVSSIQSPMPLKIPYPLEILNENLNFDGFLSEFELKQRLPVVSVPMMASIGNSNKLGDTLESLHREASRIKIQKIHRFRETGLECDDYSEMLNHLLDFKDNYDDNFEL